MEETETMDQTDTESRPLDVVALAARLGIAFPQLPTTSAAAAAAESTTTDTPYSQALPIATLASHLLAASQNLACYSNDSPAPLTMASLASQLLPGAAAGASGAAPPVSLMDSLIAPGLQLLNGQIPVLNELCNTEQQQLESNDHNLLSMTYDQLHPTLLKTEPME